MAHTDTPFPDISANLKAFASFLQENYLSEITLENLQLSRQLKLPLLDLFSHLTEELLYTLSRKSIEEYLNHILNNNLVAVTLQSVDEWKSGQLPGISREKIQLSDIVLSYSIRKQIMLKFLPVFTPESAKAVEIMTELEQIYNYIERYAFQVYIDIQQEELHKKNQFLNSLIYNNIDGISVYDRDMRVLEWNPVLEARNNIKREDIIGKNLYDMFPAYKDTEEFKSLLDVFNGHKVHITDRPYRYKSGWYEAFNIPLFDKNNEVNSYLSIIRDISERKAAEIKQKEQQEELHTLNEELQSQKEALEAFNEELQENLTQLEETQETLAINELRLREAQSIAHLGSWEYDQERNLVYWSEEMKKIFGLDDKQTSLNFETYLLFTHPDDKSKVKSLIENTLGNLTSFVTEHRIIRPDGKTRWVYTRGETVIEHGKRKKIRATSYDITGRKEAELKLIQEQYFIQKIADTTPDIIIVYDLKEENTVYANREIYEMLGYSQQEVFRIRQQGMEGTRKMIHPDDFTAMAEFLQSYATYTATGFREIEYRIKDVNGQWHWISGRFNVFKKSDEGLPVQIIGVSWDSTERKLMEENLRVREAELEKLNKELEIRVEQRTLDLKQSEERYRLFLRQSSEGIGRFELGTIGAVPVSLPVEEQIELFFQYGILVECNDALASMYGYTYADEITGAPLNSFLLPDNPENVAYIRNFISSGYRMSDAETHETDKDGNSKYFLNNLIGILEGDKLVRAWCTQRDITGEKNAKEALRRSEELLRLVTDAVPVLITYIDNEQRYRFNNKAYESWFGIKPEAIYGKHMREVLGEKAYRIIQESVHKVLSGKRAHFEMNIPYEHLGTRFVVADYIPHYEGNRVIGFYGVIADISNQKDIEEALQKALNESYEKNQELERINTDMDNFVYVASHDLRSPVVNLEAIITRLQKRLLATSNDGEQTLLTFAGEAVSRLKQTISDLTEISRAQREIDTQIEVVSFEEVFNEVKMDIATMISEAGAHLHTDFQAGQLTYAKKNLRSVLYNLISNAIKYCSADRSPEIFIATYIDAGNTVLTVQDNGLGIPEKQKHKLFTMFKRLHTHVEGSGIGLYILKRIVENQGGSVQVSSEEGKGSVFTIVFRSKNQI